MAKETFCKCDLGFRIERLRDYPPGPNMVTADLIRRKEEGQIQRGRQNSGGQVGVMWYHGLRDVGNLRSWGRKGHLP